MKKYNIEITEDQAIMLLDLLNRKIEELDKIDFDSEELIINQMQRMSNFISLYIMISSSTFGALCFESDICAN